MAIHPTAIISPKALLDSTVEVGPYAIIEDNVHIGARTVVMAHAYLTGWTEIGEDNRIHIGAVIGHLPQYIAFKGQRSYVRIGNGNTIREYVTIHRSIEEDHATVLGHRNFLMAMSHVAHDCALGNEVILANSALLAGHVVIQDKVMISGNSAVHQYVRLGRLALVSGLSRVVKDVPPFMIVEGESTVRGLNVIGMRRANIPAENREAVKHAYRLLYRSGLSFPHALEAIQAEPMCEEVREIVEFVKQSERGICKHYAK
jgi:UDP-N-acetylglucosamine acyltransferase